MKKAQLSMQMIVIAALALVVLVVSILVFRGQVTETSKGFTQVREGAQDNIEAATNQFKDLFRCTKDRCIDGKCHVCTEDGKWDLTEQPCPC